MCTGINNADPTVLHYGGHMYHGHRQGIAPSPVWASSDELWSSWSNTPLPWPQVHGHTQTYQWSRRDWNDWTPRALARFATANPRRRHVTFTPPGGSHPIIGIDCALKGARPGSCHPLVVSVP